MKPTPEIEQLSYIAAQPVWDGNLISKEARDELVKAGYVARMCGWNFLTHLGIQTCVGLGILRS